MGFNITMDQRWNWMLAKLDNKLNHWKGMQVNLAGRAMVVNTFMLSTTIYFISCWRPKEKELAKVERICRNFLWTGDTNRRGIPKINWETCTSSKDSRGLGILDIVALVDKLAVKWLIKAWSNSESSWAKLIFRNLKDLTFVGHPGWKDLGILTLLFSPLPVSPKGSSLVSSFWKSWNKAKQFIRISDEWKWAAGIRQNDSIWFPISGIRGVEPWNLQTAKRLWNKGFKQWKQLWKQETNQWIRFKDLDPRHRVTLEEWTLLQGRCLAWDPSTSRLLSGQDLPCLEGLKWSNGERISRIPNFKENLDVHHTLNKRWCLSWTKLRWELKFMSIWHPLIETKKSVLMWQILHKGIWSNSRANKICGVPPWCKRCHRCIEDLAHLFFDCPKSRIVWHHVTQVLRLTNQINWQQVLLGEVVGCSSRLCNAIRGETLWKIWRERCAVNFDQTPKEWSIEKSLYLLGKRISRDKRSPPFRHHCIYLLENNKLIPKWVPHEGDDRFIHLICNAL
ncbi:hypothetical protein KP509_31G033600 [Ceratopteris richardii]|uniref:Reverse transcriptase zinc-binding domain-containing protein n=1 Tax=Ceratopteris richardii TaxID=49495 RepID=A0A8T2QX02_CERRI|nr:hypothetical protein KP509_31G033600 [Ceratopteris richardii]